MRFTPILSQVYSMAKQNNKSFEIIYVSSDRSKEQFDEYFKTMPWLALPFGSPLKRFLSSKHNVNGIPTLIVANRDGSIITSDKQEILSPKFIQSLPSVNISLSILEDSIVSLLSDTSTETNFKYYGLKTISTIIQNIMKNPGDPKFLKLNKSSSSFQNKLNDPHIIKILDFCGFKETDQSYTFPTTYSYTKLRQTLEVLNNFILSFNFEQ